MPTANIFHYTFPLISFDHVKKSPFKATKSAVRTPPFSASHERIQTMNQTRPVVGVEKIIPAKQPIAVQNSLFNMIPSGVRNKVPGSLF